MIRDFKKFMGMGRTGLSVDVGFFNWPSFFIWAMITVILIGKYGWIFLLYGLLYRIFINLRV
jgi:hypothetical protein